MYATTKDAYKLIHDGILALSRAEETGMRIDMNYCQNQKERITHRIAVYEKKFTETELFAIWKREYGMNLKLSSPVQLGHVVYDLLELKPTKFTASGKGATDEEAIGQMGLPDLQYLIKIRKLKKVRDTYLEAFMREQVDGVVHPFFNLHTVRTMRSSSDRPNFQNIPKRDKEAMTIVRKAIFPRKGHQLIEVDFSGAEVRVACCYHQDPKMRAYIEDSTTDMHGDMAAQIFMVDDFDRHEPGCKILRQAAKNGFVFPQFYGDYYKNCAENAGCRWGRLPKTKWIKGKQQGLDIGDKYGGFLVDHLISKGIRSYEMFEDHMQKVENDFWHNRFRVYEEWKDKIWNKYQYQGYIDFLTGFRVSGVLTKNECLNTPIQGSAFHCLLWSFIQVDKFIQKFNLDTRIIGQIHDAMVLDVNPNELDYVAEMVHKIMCKRIRKHWQWINIPMEADIEMCDVDCSWNEKYDYKGDLS